MQKKTPQGKYTLELKTQTGFGRSESKYVVKDGFRKTPKRQRTRGPAITEQPYKQWHQRLKEKYRTMADDFGPKMIQTRAYPRNARDQRGYGAYPPDRVEVEEHSPKKERMLLGYTP